MADSADPELIWMYTVCKGRVYPGSAGQGIIFPEVFYLFNLMAVDIFWWLVREEYMVIILGSFFLDNSQDQIILGSVLHKKHICCVTH